jgi:hypothetical protein
VFPFTSGGADGGTTAAAEATWTLTGLRNVAVAHDDSRTPHAMAAIRPHSPPRRRSAKAPDSTAAVGRRRVDREAHMVIGHPDDHKEL